MKVVLYARVSCSQETESLSIDGQLREMHKYAKKRQWQVYREFVDLSFSGNTDIRPAFQEMIELAQSPKNLFNAILVWRFSRFARNRQDSRLYKTFLRQHAIEVVSLNESEFNESELNPSRKLIEEILEVIDEYHCKSTSQDIKLALREKMMQGFFIGSKPPLGYCLVRSEGKKSRLQIDAKNSKIVQKIFQLCIAGNGAKSIAQTLYKEQVSHPKGRAWSSSSIRDILKNSVYTQKHPTAIISKDTFLQAQQCIKQRTPRKSKAKKSVYLLSGILYCGVCGGKMHGQSSKPKPAYYCCYSYSKYGKHVCSVGMVNCQKLETSVVLQVFHKIQQKYSQRLFQLVQRELSDHQTHSNPQQQIHNLEQKLQRYYEEFESGHTTMECITPRLEQILQQIRELRQRNQNQLVCIPETKQQLMQSYHHSLDLQKIWRSIEVRERKDWLGNIIRRVDYHADRIMVDYRFMV